MDRISYGIAESPVGRMLVAGTSKGIAALAFLEEFSETEVLDDLRLNLGRLPCIRDDAFVADYIAYALDYLGGQKADANPVPMDLRGTEFQMRVWAELMRVPYGGQVTYTDIARRLGLPRSVRAVASAIGDNPISLVVPCHRVLRKDGSLGGYRWGLNVKRRLLDFERGLRDARGLAA